MEKIKIFVLTAIIFLIIDIIWLMFFAKKLYMEELSSMLILSDGAISPRLLPALVVYLLIISGITFLIVPAANQDILKAFMYGAMYGLIAYGVYNFTNLSILKTWSVQIACMETLYGALAGALTSFLVVGIKRFI